MGGKGITKEKDELLSPVSSPVRTLKQNWAGGRLGWGGGAQRKYLVPLPRNGEEAGMLACGGGGGGGHL